MNADYLPMSLDCLPMSLEEVPIGSALCRFRPSFNCFIRYHIIRYILSCVQIIFAQTAIES
ncbi:MAG: hypothetical protein M3Q33_08815 [Acidobacteriota bacterium]|nr:hypothetical protein [Acidobacteriota bacterium]